MSDSDSKTLLAQVPKDGSGIGNQSVREALRWRVRRYEAVRDALVEAGKLEKGRGRGGSVRRVGKADVGAKRTSVVQSPVKAKAGSASLPARAEADQDRLLAAVPADGSTIGNQKLCAVLGWKEARYVVTRDVLVAAGTLEKGRGRGGTVRRCGQVGPALRKASASTAAKTSSGGNHAHAAKPQAATARAGNARGKTGNAMFEQTFKNIDDVLWKDAGCTSELDYTEQTSWLLFLKYLDALEADKATEAQLDGKKYVPILDAPYRWATWAAPKGADGAINHNTALTGDDLIQFVNGKLFPFLQGFKAKATGPNTIEYKIGEIFSEIKNRIQSGYNLREIIDHIDELRFQSQSEKHELSHLYEAKIKNMGNAGRNGGEYYTPRPLIRAIVAVTAPKLGETICDPAVGSAGFLCEAFEYLKASNPQRTTAQDRTLQDRTFYGKEKKSLAYVIAIMNLILHGIEAPNIIHTNTLAENIADVQDKDRFQIILANPPFGGKERKEVQQNFPIRTGETAFLFLQYFIKILKAGGRAGIVIKNTFLSNADNASVSLRKKLLEECNLHSILDCPGGTFIGAGVKTVVLFFEKGSKTRKVWYYQLDPGRSMGKTNPLNDDDLAEFITLQKSKADSLKSWSVDVATIDQGVCDLSVKNPNGGEEAAHRSPQDIMEEIAALDAESADALGKIKALL